MIESNIPIPERKTDIIRKMIIGDSMLIGDDIKLADTYRTIARSIGYKVSIRKTDKGYRLWRKQ